MSLKNTVFAALFAFPLMAATAVVAEDKAEDKAAPAVEVTKRIPYMEEAINHLMEVRKAIIHDMKHADTEEEALEAAKNVGHIMDAIETLHAVEHMHQDGTK